MRHFLHPVFNCEALRDLVPFVQFKKPELLLVKLQVKAWNFAESNTAAWVFFTFFKMYKFYHIAQSVSISLAKL